MNILNNKNKKDYNNQYNRNIYYNESIKKNNDNQKKKKIKDEHTIEMFGRWGWICEFCNNFNYDTRKKCIRCHKIKN